MTWNPQVLVRPHVFYNVRIVNQHLSSILYLLEEHLSICQTSGSHCLGGWWHVSASQHGTIVEHLCHCVQLCHIDNTQTQEHTYTKNMKATVCHAENTQTQEHTSTRKYDFMGRLLCCVQLCHTENTQIRTKEHTNTNKYGCACWSTNSGDMQRDHCDYNRPTIQVSAGRLSNPDGLCATINTFKKAWKDPPWLRLL